MFTGIIEEIGRVAELRLLAGGAIIAVNCRRVLDGLHIGDSVAVNGVCLTVVEKGVDLFRADVSRESLERSNLGGLKRGSEVNLERALSLGSRLGGHIVQGHVDGVGNLKTVGREGEWRVYTFSMPASIADYVVEKGSIAVDGVSLTVNRVTESGFSVSVIPHTAKITTLGDRKPGDTVNLEADIIGKYVERLLSFGKGPGRAEAGGLTLKKLAESGFV